MPKSTQIIQRLTPEQVRPFAALDCRQLGDLQYLGCQFPGAELAALHGAYAGASMDSAMVTPVSSGVPVDFLRHFLPGVVRTVTAARRIDDLVGRTHAGEWHDEEIIQPIVEHLGRPGLYGDETATPLAEYNTSFDRRTIVRFEEGFKTGALGEARDAAIKVSMSAEKRAALTSAMAGELNAVGFYGYNDGDNRTYGLLNDPNLPAYITLPDQGGVTKWAGKDFAAITADLRLMASKLRVQSGELIDPERDACTLAIAGSAKDALYITNEHGISVHDWLDRTYPKWVVKTAPEFENANGGLAVGYLYAHSVPGPDESGEQPVLDQFVPAAIRLVGTERQAKGVLEVYSNATAGVMCRAPYAVVRVSGI